MCYEITSTGVKLQFIKKLCAHSDSQQLPEEEEEG